MKNYSMTSPGSYNGPYGNVETTTVNVEVLAVTDEALLLDNGLIETWFPKSQVFDDRRDTAERGEHLPEFRIAYWLAKRKGLIQS